MEAGSSGAQAAPTTLVVLNMELPFEQDINAFVDIGVEFHYCVRKTVRDLIVQCARERWWRSEQEQQSREVTGQFVRQ